jgi:hypothetical protein
MFNTPQYFECFMQLFSYSVFYVKAIYPHQCFYQISRYFIIFKQFSL